MNGSKGKVSMPQKSSVDVWLHRQIWLMCWGIYSYTWTDYTIIFAYLTAAVCFHFEHITIRQILQFLLISTKHSKTITVISLPAITQHYLIYIQSFNF